jgi:hypothetical protein
MMLLLHFSCFVHALFVHCACFFVCVFGRLASRPVFVIISQPCAYYAPAGQKTRTELGRNDVFLLGGLQDFFATYYLGT